jgi:hypothetical protein
MSDNKRSEGQYTDKDRDKDCGCGKQGSGGKGRGTTGEGRTGDQIPWCRLITEQGRKYTPWLLMQTDLNDLGLRPLPPNTVFWASPDIWVESSDPFGRPVAGQNNFVHARVYNLGKAPAFPTRVDFYWGDPSLGLGATTMHHIGTEWVYIWNHSTVDVRCNTPWVPVMLNGGHECLIVNTTNPVRDPIQHPFQAWLDRHVGQRNVMVTAAAPGQMIRIPLAARNIFPMTVATRFMARTQRFAIARELPRDTRKIDILNQAAFLGRPDLNTAKELLARYVPGTGPGRLAATVAGAIADFRPKPPLVYRVEGKKHPEVEAKLDGHKRAEAGDPLASIGHLFAATGTLATQVRGQENEEDFQLHAMNLQANEQRTLEIEVQTPRDAVEGEFVVTHITQMVEQVPVGGYTILAAIGKFLEVR